MEVPEPGDESDVGVVQELPILSSEFVDEDFDSSLRLSLDPRLFDSSFSTCLKENNNYINQKSTFHKVNFSSTVLLSCRSLNTTRNSLKSRKTLQEREPHLL